MGRRWALAALAAVVLCPATALGQGDEPRSTARALTMREIVGMAIRTSPDAQAAATRIARAEAEGDLATSRYLPTIEARVQGGGTAVQDALFLRREHYTLTTTQAEGRVDLRWTLWDFGRTSSSVAAAEALRSAAEHGTDATKALVAQRAAQLYVTLAYDQSLVESKKIAVKHRVRFAAIAKALADRGVRPAIDEARARVALEAARHDLTIAEARLAIDRARLATLAGIDPSELERVARPLLPAVEDDVAKATDLGERARPEVAAASAEVEASDRRVDAQRAGWLPRVGIDVAGSYRLSRRDFDDATVPRREGIAMLTITVPVFDAAVGAAVDVAKADLAAAHAREERARRQARLDAIESAVSLKAAKAALARAKELENVAQAALALIEARYASGLATPFELVDAETSDVDARETLLAAELRLQLATVDVLVATGRAKSLEGS